MRCVGKEVSYCKKCDATSISDEIATECHLCVKDAIFSDRAWACHQYCAVPSVVTTVQTAAGCRDCVTASSVANPWDCSNCLMRSNGDAEAQDQCFACVKGGLGGSACGTCAAISDPLARWVVQGGSPARGGCRAVDVFCCVGQGRLQGRRKLAGLSACSAWHMGGASVPACSTAGRCPHVCVCGGVGVQVWSDGSQQRALYCMLSAMQYTVQHNLAAARLRGRLQWACPPGCTAAGLSALHAAFSSAPFLLPPPKNLPTVPLPLLALRTPPHPTPTSQRRHACFLCLTDGGNEWSCSHLPPPGSLPATASANTSALCSRDPEQSYCNACTASGASPGVVKGCISCIVPTLPLDRAWACSQYCAVPSLVATLEEALDCATCVASPTVTNPWGCSNCMLRASDKQGVKLCYTCIQAGLDGSSCGTCAAIKNEAKRSRCFACLHWGGTEWVCSHGGAM